MTEPNLEPTPRGWLDKVYDSGAFNVLAAMVIFLFAIEPMSDRVGYWPALAILIPAGIALAILVSLPFVRRQKQRAPLDADRGIGSFSRKPETVRRKMLKGWLAQDETRAGQTPLSLDQHQSHPLPGHLQFTVP